MAAARQLARVVVLEPLHRRTWAELAFFIVSSAVAWVGLLVLVALGLFGTVLSVVFFGVILLAAAMRAGRQFGGWQRSLATALLAADIAGPEPFSPRPGLLGWLRSTFSDRAAWRAIGYCLAKIPLSIFGAWFALSVWVEALLGIASPLTGQTDASHFGAFGRLLVPAPTAGLPGGLGRAAIFVGGVVLLVVAPWTMRFVVYLDLRLMHLLLGPDAATSRVQRLEASRAKTLDVATETLRRIERNLHDGTQAQLVALAMRLGQAKDKLDHVTVGDPGAAQELAAVRHLLDEAHRGAKEAITDLRDLARGIHPPALDTGLENALTTLAARSAVPTEVNVSLQTRPSAAIEAICYFCAAELLANIAQHSRATRASLTCAQHGPWLRVVVRDNGCGGAAAAPGGSASSGLAGLAERVSAVDGHLSIASPKGGPTAVTVDLPCRA